MSNLSDLQSNCYQCLQYIMQHYTQMIQVIQMEVTKVGFKQLIFYVSVMVQELVVSLTNEKHQYFESWLYSLKNSRDKILT